MKSHPTAQPRPAERRARSPVRYRRNPDAVTREADGHLFLSVGNAIHELNPAGAALWNLLDLPRSETEMVEIFAAAFPQKARSNLRRDVKSVLGALRDAGYIVVSR